MEPTDEVARLELLKSNPSLRRVALVGGTLTRDQVGNGYDREIQEIATRKLLETAQGMTERAALSLAGFESTEQVEAFRASRLMQNANLLDELDGLLLESNDLAEWGNELLGITLNSPNRLEVWRTGENHDTEEWRRNSGVDFVKSSHRFSLSSAIGDSSFCGYFRSSDFPDYELAMAGLKSRKKSFWAAANKANER